MIVFKMFCQRKFLRRLGENVSQSTRTHEMSAVLLLLAAGFPSSRSAVSLRLFPSRRGENIVLYFHQAHYSLGVCCSNLSSEHVWIEHGEKYCIYSYKKKNLARFILASGEFALSIFPNKYGLSFFLG